MFFLYNPLDSKNILENYSFRNISVFHPSNQKKRFSISIILWTRDRILLRKAFITFRGTYPNELWKGFSKCFRKFQENSHSKTEALPEPEAAAGGVL